MSESKIPTIEQILDKWGKALKDNGFELNVFYDNSSYAPGLRSESAFFRGTEMQVSIVYCTDIHRIQEEGAIRRIPDGWWEIRSADLNAFHPPCTQHVIPDYLVTSQGMRLDDLDEWEWLRDYVCNQPFYITLGKYVEHQRRTESTDEVTIVMPGFEPGWALVVKFS